MNVLVIGSGGREHALAWKVSQSSRVKQVFVAPGNAGTAREFENVDIAATNIESLVAFAKNNSIDLTVVGPEAPLCAGVVDAFQEENLRVFGPRKSAAQLEGSKIFCKQTLKNAHVPTAEYNVFDNAADAERYIDTRFVEVESEVPVVVKADGLAAGKGAIVCGTRAEVFEAIDRIARSREFGDAGNRFIIEDRLDGQEASILALTDGKTILTLPPAQDHKPAFDNDKGPNPGGMGAYCPTPAVDANLMGWVEENVLVPTVHMMKRTRNPFHGILYAGLMISDAGTKVLEYNVRFGDPECQPVLMRLQTDLVDLIDAVIDGRLSELNEVQWDPRPSICVVMASNGYPGSYEKGKVITGLEEADKVENVKVFHAGTKLDGENVVTSGGRVLGITAISHSIADAKLKAYQAIKHIRWDGAWCRKDIADKAMITV